MPGRLLTNAQLATLEPGGAPYGLISGGALAFDNGRIVWVGEAPEIPSDFARWPRTDCEDRLVTPALIDCHTHLVFGGNRAREFELRLEGASYEEIARAGGGILSTVQATRAASEDELVAAALPRLDALIAGGAGTVEVKSGYGLDTETELKMLRTARRLGRERNVRIVTTFLGAHAVPPEYEGRPDAYIDEACLPALDAAAEARLADAVDGFCEKIAFTPEQIGRVFARARKHGLPVKLHAEQLSDQGGAKLAAEYGALSADHLEYLDTEGVAAMKRAGMAAVMLPGAFYSLRETKLPPIEAFREAGVPLAVATDANPGSSPLTSLLLAMNMACTLFRMTPEEALAGVTREAARALGLGEETGTLAPGKRAELAVWDVEQPAELAYFMGANPLHRRIMGDTE
ncbi:MAG: imidazolonepropionase [Alphaproteobacteria bacterium]